MGGSPARRFSSPVPAGGLGRAYAVRFAGEGARVLLADIQEDQGESRAAVEAAGGTAEAFQVDMGDEESIQAFAAAVLAGHERLDVLINNAGMHAGRDPAPGLLRARHGEVATVLRREHASGRSCSPRRCDPALAPRRRALIINKSSMASYNPATAYGITKASLNVFTHAMATQFGADGIVAWRSPPG